MSCDGEKVGPGVDVVNAGSTSASVLSATSPASVGLVPCTLKPTSPCLAAPTSTHRPTTPLQTIMIAANTVSRASAPVAAPPANISATINATSITVTATASTSVPNGSP